MVQCTSMILRMYKHTPAFVVSKQETPNNADPICSAGHVPFYQQDQGGLRSSRLLDDTNNKYHEIYHFGIIDFLQKYNKKKKLANFAKTLKYDKVSSYVACVREVLA